MRHLYQRTKNYLRRLIRTPLPLTKRTILDQVLIVREGTVRLLDYDDAWLLACSQHAETMIDVGANKGFTALLVLIFNPDLKELIAIEASPEALAICAENLIRNHLAHRVRFVSAFASNKEKEIARLWTLAGGAAGSMYREHATSASQQDSQIDIPTVTVDHLCSIYNFIPDLIKIDVEGAEGLVLEGGVNCAKYQQTRFLVEMHSNPELSMRDNAHSALKWCEQTNYHAWYMKTASLLEDPAQIEKRGRCHLLLQPIGWEYPDWLNHIPQGAPLEMALSP